MYFKCEECEKVHEIKPLKGGGVKCSNCNTFMQPITKEQFLKEIE